ncbi:MAG: hypothetical protein ABSG95_04340 [Solirubrobacteraceae bacterium]
MRQPSFSGDRTPPHNQGEIDLRSQIIVTAEQSERAEVPVVLGECPSPEHLADERSGAKIIDRFVVEHARALRPRRARARAAHAPA